METATANYAFDKKSARSFDADGRMRVRDCIISVAEVNPYYGKEIPKSKDLGLNPAEVYDLYRDPAELERAVDSFNGPLMIRHIAQTADEPRKEYIGGTVYNARWNAADSTIRADLLFIDKQAIEYVQTEVLRDLSASYRYRADMTPVEIEGRPAHGSMRDIVGNHVAIVEDGRATGAHVADSALSSQPGVTTVTDNAKELAELQATVAELKTELAGIRSGAQVHANDADLEAKRAADEAAAKAKEDEDKKRAEDEAAAKAKEDEKHAMDAKSVQALVDAAVSAERDRAKALEQAKRDCRNDLGDMIAMDSAGEIYRAALKVRGVDVESIPAGTEQIAYQAINVAARPAAPAVRANDSKSSDGTKPRFDTSRFNVRLNS